MAGKVNTRDILFVGGDVNRLASIKIRCAEIAARLGCACHYQARSVDELPAGYKAYVCVKPDFGHAGLERLAGRARVVWDILDHQPPVSGVHVYIASTGLVRKAFGPIGDVRVIPHHHCNHSGRPNDGVGRRVAYVGSAHWYPSLPNIAHRPVFVDRMSRAEVEQAYRETDLCLNLRRIDPVPSPTGRPTGATPPAFIEHVRLNSGMKLINCLGFGLPSLSSPEPAYREIGEGCTVFSDPAHCEEDLERLLRDDALFHDLRRRCLELAPAYHIDEIVGKYRALFASL